MLNRISPSPASGKRNRMYIITMSPLWAALYILILWTFFIWNPILTTDSNKLMMNVQLLYVYSRQNLCNGLATE